jgi:hypothetical protein
MEMETGKSINAGKQWNPIMDGEERKQIILTYFGTFGHP